MSFGFGKSPFPAPRRPTFDDVEFVPQAILRVPMSYFSELGYEVVHSYDDLDEFDGTVIFSTGLKLPVAIRQYSGYPEGTSTIFLPYEIREVGEISDKILSLVEEFRLQQADIVWQRKDDPDL
jgi:hypothetical protein